MKLDWKNKELIGRGGNGKVYRIENSNGDFFAVKVLTRLNSSKAYKRFRDEINVLNQLENLDGVIKIIEFNLPEKNQ